MRKILLVLTLTSTMMPAQAFKLFHRNNKAPQQVAINEEVLIEGKFGNSTTNKLNPATVLDLRIAIHIPRDQQYLTVTTLYDEINENPIEQITWVVDNGKKQAPTKIKAYKIDQIINQKIESIALEYNPTLAYDRINDNKHIINKTFYYDQAAIFGNMSKKPKLFLELYIPAAQGLKTKSIRIDEQIYKTIPKEIIPSKTTFNRRDINQRTPPPTIPPDIESDADLEYAKQQLNNFNMNNTNPANPNNLNPNNQGQQQMEQTQEQMQLDAIEEEYGDFGEEDEDDEDYEEF